MEEIVWITLETLAFTGKTYMKVRKLCIKAMPDLLITAIFSTKTMTEFIRNHKLVTDLNVQETC